MTSAPLRIRAFDWLRGLAVLFMVECHALALLRPGLRATLAAQRLDFINGLVAPSFIFASGFSLALVQVRAARAGGPRGARVLKTLRRLGEVLAVGALVNFIWFHQLVWLLRLDILVCIGVSLLLVLPLIVGLAPYPRLLAVNLLLVGVVLFAAAPTAEAVHGPWANLVNRNGSLHPVFPLLPWMGYVMLGASVGAVAGAAMSLRPLYAYLGGLALLGGVASGLRDLFVRLYPPHAFEVSDPANHGHRLLLVALLLLGLLTVEAMAGDGRFRRSLPIRWVELMGTTSLAGYFFHEELLFFQVRGVALGTVFRDRCGWGLYLFWLAVVLGLTTALVKLVDKLYPAWDRRLSPRSP